MKATYTAIDGVSEIGSETLVSLCQEDSVKGGNLLSNPSSISSWTSDSDGTISQKDNLTIKHIKTASNAASVGRSVTTESGKYYLMRAYCYMDTATATVLFAGTSLHGSNLKVGDTKYLSGVQEIVFKATSTTSYVHFQINGSSPQDTIAYWSSIEVLELETLGVDETTELQTNGDFSASPGTTGWTAGPNTTLSIVSGAIRVTSVSNGVSYGYQAITTESGKMYQFTVDLVTDGATGGAFVYAGTTAGNSDLGYYATSGVPGTYTIYFKASGTTTYISMAGSSSELAAEYFEWDNAVVTETGELVQNGGFNKDFLWTKGTGWTISGGVATHAAGTASSIDTDSNITLSIGDHALGQITVSGRTAGSITIVTSSGLFNGQTIETYSSNGTLVFTSQVSGTGPLRIYATSDFDGSIDNITLRRAVTDISSNGDGLEVHGEIVLVPVNYNSTTVAYANFSANNYLKQPYNSNLDPGTGDYTVSGVFDTEAITSSRLIVDRRDASGPITFRIYLDGSGYFHFQTHDGTTDHNLATTTTYEDGEKHHFVCVKASGVKYIYIDGVLITSGTPATNNTLTNTSADLFIGVSYNQASTEDWEGDISIIKIDIGTLWTAQQVLNMYNDEKVLFNQNEIYSVVGDSLTLGVKVTNSNPGQQTKKIVNEALDGTREFVQINQKKTFSCQTVPVNFSDKNKVFKFLRSVEAQSFTFSERSFEYGADNQMTVYKETSNEQLNRLSNSDDLYTVNFTVRER